MSTESYRKQMLRMTAVLVVVGILSLTMAVLQAIW